jgi:presenilin 1
MNNNLDQPAIEDVINNNQQIRNNNTNNEPSIEDDYALLERAQTALHELLYSADAFSAVVFPVAVTMILSAITVVFVNDGSNGQSTGSALPYLVYEETPNESQEQLFTQGLINALAIVGGVIVMTFIILALFYFNMMRTLFALIMAQLALLLGFSTGLLMQTALWLLHVPTDAITYSLIFWNFAIGGVVSIFYTVAVPEVFTQGYLVIISITMTWVWIRYFPEFTLWILLAVIALYDLCAVLTPCGPLKILVGMMQEKNAVPPGLLYEARIQRDGITSSNVQGTATTTTTTNTNTSGPTIPLNRRPLPSPPISEDNDQDVPLPITSSSTSRLMVTIPSSQQQQHQQQFTNNTNTVDDNEDNDAESIASSEMPDKSIRVGLGDFIFYSIAGSKAALNSFTCFISVFVVVLLGLGMTLVLLAVYKKALPALPFSIFLGLIFYFLTDILIVPRVESSMWVFE